MNNYYTLIYLTEELKQKLESSNFEFSISPHKNVWEGYFTSKNGDRLRLIFSTTPGEIALFPDSYRAPKKNNVLNFFESLENQKVTGVELAAEDRFISIHFDEKTTLFFQLFGNDANIFRVKENRTIDAFKNKDQVVGEEPPQPRKAKKMENGPPENAGARRLILHYDIKFPRQLIKPVIRHYRLGDAPPEEIQQVVNKLTNSLMHNPSFRVLENGELCFLPAHLLPAGEIETFGTANEAVRFTYYKASHLRRFEKKLKNIQPALENRINKTRQALRQLEGAEKALERAEKYQKYGHLLMSQAHLKRDSRADHLELPDFYNNNEPVQIPLKDHLSIAENAQYYYDKSARAERRVEESKRRRKEVKKELMELQQLQSSLDSIEKLYELEDWISDHEEILQKLGIAGSGKQKRSLPWRTTEYNGYEIRIGKNAKSNDRLTTEAHKEDIWLHARGTGGSHVIIRMNNHPEKPPKHIIRKAASYAAWHSKLRGSGLVPVIVTKKKYVIKPKGAHAGTVRVDREEVEMVKPEKP